MKKLGLKGKSWLKGFHIFFACAWVGAGISMLLLSLLDGHIQNGDELYAVNDSIQLLDYYIIIPAALGSLITGLLISLFTNWGFFKFNWVIFKWVATVAQIIFGTFWLGPWTDGATAIADLEVEHEEAETSLWYVRYWTEDGRGRFAAHIAGWQTCMAEHLSKGASTPIRQRLPSDSPPRT